MIVEQKNAARRIKNTNRLFLSSLCFVTIASFGIGRMGMNFSMETSLIISQMLFWIPITLYLLITRTNPLRLIPFHKISISTVGMVILFGLLLIPVMTWINLISMMFVENTVAAIDQQMQRNSLLFNLLLMAVMPAFSEEFMIRGIYFQQYRESGIFKGAVISGLVFGLMHMNFNQFSYAAVLGIILALLVEATGSIFSSIIVHFVFNAYSVFIAHFQDQILTMTGDAVIQEVTRSDIVEMTISYTSVAFIVGILAFSVFLWIVQHCKTTEHMKQIFVSNYSEEGKKIKVMTPSFVIGVVIGFGLMILLEWIS